MSSFSEVKLKDLTTLITKGTTPTTHGYDYVDEGINFIKAESVTHEGFIDDSVFAQISSVAHEKLSRSQLKEDDILFSIAGVHLGKNAVVRKEHLPANTNQALAVIRVDKTKALPKFIHYHFLDPYQIEYINSLTAQSAQPNINLTDTGNLSVKLPSLKKQREIVGVLSAYDDLISTNSRRIEILEEMARRIYREWFVHFRYPGHEDDALVDSGTDLGEVPEGWEVKKFGDLVEYLRDRVKNEEVEEEVSVLGLGDMPKESINLSQWENTDDIGSTKLRFKNDDILFGKIRPYFHKVGFAQTSGVCSSDIFVWRPYETKDYVLALLTASSDKFVETATNSSSGTKMPRAKWDVLEKYLIAYPPKELLERLNSFVGSYLKQIRTLSFQNKKLKETRNLLLPKLISGKLDVEEVTV